MKTLHRLYIYPDTIDRESRDRAATFLSIPDVLTIKNSFRRDPDILNNLVLESDADIDERCLTKYVAEPGFHQIHLVLTDKQWRELGLRPSLYGQSRTVNGQVITYGAWDKRRSILEKYDDGIQAALTESTLGEWHEAHHGIAPMLGVMNPTTHAAFYGYKEADSHKKDSRRWVRKPYPLQAWRALPWHYLPDRTPRWVVLEEELRKTQFSVLLYVQSILTGMFEKRRQQNRFQPLVGRTAQTMVARMKAAGFPIRVTSTYRSHEEQARLYAQGRTTPGNIVTNAKPGESFHNYGVAFDVVFREQGYDASPEMWQSLGSVGKALGLEWGGDWKNPDRPHFSQTLGYTLKDFQSGNVDYSLFK
ncbi:M15 family metallopeptidase [Sulfitobacter sp. 1A10445]|uniref:M15 family metallopeptidase n=1 Tax=unclassified Sulfitobacter TaxID=196795 RepID=UPI003744C09D